MNVVVKKFPDEEWRGFKSIAAQRGITVSVALTEAVKEWKEKHRVANPP